MVEVSVVLPCRNEEKAVGVCIKKIKRVFKENKVDGEIIVSDSSSDKSREIARKLGARIVHHGKKGYGIAYLEGFKAAKGKYIIMGDADNTYDFLEIPRFLKEIDVGKELKQPIKFAYDTKSIVAPIKVKNFRFTSKT